MKRSVRMLSAVAAAGAMTAALAACSPAQKSDAEGDDPSSQRLVVARGGDIDKLDPHMGSAPQTFQTLELVYDSLFEVDDQLQVQPALASGWEYDEAGTELTVTLREGVTFHDGSEFDSADVKASVERLLDESFSAIARTNLVSIEEIAAPDPLTVVMTLSEPNGTLPAAFTDLNAAMLSADDIEAGTVAQEPNGTGPFVFGKWTQGQSVTLDANPDYWGGAPSVAGVDLRVIGDQSSILAGLRAGEFDLGVITDASVAQRADESLRTETASSVSYWSLMMNTDYGPLSDPLVRQAISCAIDREQTIEAAVFGEGTATGPFTLPAFERRPYEGLPCDGRDVETSRRLLAEAGLSEGLTLKTSILTGEDPTPVNIGQSLKSQLAEAGITLELENLETNVYVPHWFEGDFQTAISPNSGKPDPHLIYARYFASDGSLFPAMSYSSPELDQLFADGKAATDPAESQAIAEEISLRLGEASPIAWLFTPNLFWIMQPDVSGFVPMPNGSLRSLREVGL